MDRGWESGKSTELSFRGNPWKNPGVCPPWNACKICF